MLSGQSTVPEHAQASACATKADVPRLLFDGKRILDNQTAEDLELEDGDAIDVRLERESSYCDSPSLHLALTRVRDRRMLEEGIDTCSAPRGHLAFTNAAAAMMQLLRNLISLYGLTCLQYARVSSIIQVQRLCSAFHARTCEAGGTATLGGLALALERDFPEPLLSLLKVCVGVVSRAVGLDADAANLLLLALGRIGDCL